VAITASFGEVVAQIDKAVAGQGERLVVKDAADLACYGEGFAPTFSAGPDVKGEDVLVGGGEVAVRGADSGLADGDVGERWRLRCVVVDAGSTECRENATVGRECGDDGLLE